MTNAVDIEAIKQANRIEDLVEEAGFRLEGRGRYRRWSQHGSFVVDTGNQSFHDNHNQVGAGLPDRGDIVDWVCWWKKVQFKDAIEFLARRAGMELPDRWAGDNEVRLAARAKEDALTVICRRYVQRLWRTHAALTYARGRAWDDEAIKAAGLGYTGSGDREEADELRKDLEANLVDPESPGAVSLLGYTGDVAAWGRKHQVEVDPAWVQAGRIPGAPKGMLVYPHVAGGRVVYVSFRGIREKRHHNLPAALAGPKQAYRNAVWAPQAESVVVVEGQADAVSLGAMGQAAVALAGSHVSEDLLRQLRGHETVYLGLDVDTEGGAVAAKAGAQLAAALGPLVRLVRWPQGNDANAWHQALAGEQVAVEAQAAALRSTLLKSPTLVEDLAAQVGAMDGAERAKAMKDVMAMVAQLDGSDRAQLRSKLAKFLGVNVRDFGHMLAETEKLLLASVDEGEEGEVETAGGYIKGWLVDLLYDPEKQRTFFAYRDPDGKIDTATQLEIEGTTYKPLLPDDLLLKGVVVLPSALGGGLSESELVARIVALVLRYYLIDEFYARLLAYYVMFTYHFDSFRSLVYLRVLGDFGSGKSRLLWMVGYLSRRLIKLTGATTEASLFRIMDRYKGTLVIDEADQAESDLEDTRTKLMNQGNQRDLMVVRQQDDGRGGYKSVAFDVYGPKILATRRRFQDEALESRCLTLETIKHSSAELKSRGIPFELNRAFDSACAELRNELLLFRLKTWLPDREVAPDLADEHVQARLNQVMMPVKEIISDPVVREEITQLTRRYQQRMVTERSMEVEAKVLQAIVEIWQAGPVTEKEGKAIEPYYDLSMGNIAKMANRVIDQENADPDEEGEDGEEGGGNPNRKKLTSRGVGSYLKNNLNLQSEKAKNGPLKSKYVLVWEEERIRGLCAEYGVEIDG
ncbi:MAG: toprim domain-containing protein [Anaerolineales bacterium]|nr:toprim domain-containing protein [Anaerolineales bacterium]MCW5855310.1 toprim domain-containing protein [Anaerolineales bacterium]